MGEYSYLFHNAYDEIDQADRLQYLNTQYGETMSFFLTVSQRLVVSRGNAMRFYWKCKASVQIHDLALKQSRLPANPIPEPVIPFVNQSVGQVSQPHQIPNL